MVRSKEVPKKKPKDPLLTTPPRPRGGFLDEGPPWTRGGAAVSPAPAPASVPSYMRATSSSDAKAGRRGRLGPAAASASPSPARWTPAASVSASASPARRRSAVRLLTRGKVLFPEAPVAASGGGLGRATCSSTIKEAKFPDALDLAPGATDAEGPAALRVCPYTYCSLNGHAHAPAVPLRSFLSSRRRLIKTQQSMKLKGVSAFRKKSGDKNGGGGSKVASLIDEEAAGDYFVEVYAGPRVSSETSVSDMSLDEIDATVKRMEFVVFDRCGADEDNEKGKKDLVVCDDAEPEPHPRTMILLLEEGKHDGFRDSLPECGSADIGGDFVEELPWMKYHGYEYESLDDDISEEQRMREEAGEAVIFEEQEEQGTSGRSTDECKEGAGEGQEANDEGFTSNLVHETEVITDQVVACGVDGRDEEDSILNKVCHSEASTGQGTADENHSEDVYRLEISDKKITGCADNIPEESFKEETSLDLKANDDWCNLESDGDSEVTKEQGVKGEECTADDGSEMDISEDTISCDGCKEDFSEEVTSRAVPEDDMFEQYDNAADDSTTDDVFEQDCRPDNKSNDAQKELGNITRKLEDASEETVTAQQINQENTVDAQKELETSTYIFEEASEESAIAQESSHLSTLVNEDDQFEPEITPFKLKDASEESDICQESSLNDDAECATYGAEMGSEITRCKLADSSKETGIDGESVKDVDSVCVCGEDQNDSVINKCKSEDAFKESVATQEIDQSNSASNVSSDEEETLEDDCTACVSDDGQNEADQNDSSANVSFDAEETVEDDCVACVSDDAQNDMESPKGKLEDASKEFVSTQEAGESYSSANVSPDAQNESELTSSELVVVAISDDIENESKVSTCKSEDVFEESVVQEADHDDSFAYAGNATQNEYHAIPCASEGVQEEMDVIQEDDDEDNTSGAQKKLKTTACESEGASEKTAIPKDVEGDVSTIDASFSSQEDTTVPKFDACEDFHVTEETNQSFNGHISAEFTNATEPSIDDICGAFSRMNLKGDVYFDPAESATCPRNKLIISRRRRIPEEEEYLRGFNPRGPNFLPLELDPDAEKVDLKHQMMEERKNAEEWMTIMHLGGQ